MKVAVVVDWTMTVRSRGSGHVEVWDVRHEEGQPVGRQSVVVISGGGQLGGSRPGGTRTRALRLGLRVAPMQDQSGLQVVARRRSAG